MVNHSSATTAAIQWKRSATNGVQSADGRFFVSARGRNRYERIYTAYDKATGRRGDFFRMCDAKAWLTSLAG